MELSLLVYTISVISNLNFLIVILVVLSLLAALFCGLASTDFGTSKDEKLKLHKYAKRFSISALVMCLLFALLPSEKTMYVMVGAYAAQKVAENPDVQRLSEKTLKVIEDKLDEHIAAKKK